MLQTISPENEAPPPYTRSPGSTVTSSSSAAGSSCSSDAVGDETYEYTSKAISLSFSQRKIQGVRLPVYGSEGVVSGEVSLRPHSSIESVTVSLRGEIKTVIECACRPTLTSATSLLEINSVLWSKANEGHISAVPDSLPFSLAFPRTTKDYRTPLPTSFIGATVEGTMRVRYKVTVLVRRSGWRGNDSVETEIFYLPRFEEAEGPSSSLFSTPDQEPLGSPYDLKIINLATSRILAGKVAPSLVNVHLAYPQLVSLAHSCSIYFNIWLSSLDHPSESLQALVPHISVQLVRKVTVIARGSTTTEKIVVCQQKVQTLNVINKPDSQVLSLNGRLDVPRDIWRSWAVPEAGSVSYSLKVNLPPSARPEIAYIDHTEPLVIIAGSGTTSDFPDTPDLGAIPSPASLLKKTLLYMPMRV